MNTEPTPLQERLARAIHKDELDGEWAELLDVYRLEYLATAAAVLPIIAAEVRKAQADAWDEGFEVGEGNGYAIGRDIDTDENTENPYREQED